MTTPTIKEILDSMKKAFGDNWWGEFAEELSPQDRVKLKEAIETLDDRPP